MSSGRSIAPNKIFNRMYLFIPLGILVLFSFSITFFMKWVALKLHIMDIPNERSAHSKSTPRGGGLSIVLSFTLSYLITGVIFGNFNHQITLGLVIPGIAVALTGLYDDCYHSRPATRLLVYVFCATCLVLSQNGLPSLTIFGITLDPGLAGILVSILAVTWIINLYNFMDGIDNIATTQALSGTLITGILLNNFFLHQHLTLMYWILSSCILGFLLYNLLIETFFLGDAGSSYIGFMLSGLIILSAHVDQNLLWAWLILLGVFITDATLTLLIRIIKKENLLMAHSNHAYQHAARLFKSHNVVVFGILGINILWLSPLAFLVATESIESHWGMLIAYTPITFLVLYFKNMLPFFPHSISFKDN
jgi:Fuc2NAc and GlcNAc transferase